jgi:hypothetical protein
MFLRNVIPRSMEPHGHVSFVNAVSPVFGPGTPRFRLPGTSPVRTLDALTQCIRRTNRGMRGTVRVRSGELRVAGAPARRCELFLFFRPAASRQQTRPALSLQT